jgi:hypothetical protein
VIDKSRDKARKRDPLPSFLPVPREKIRHDGWTPERQTRFIEALADTGSVRAATPKRKSSARPGNARSSSVSGGSTMVWDRPLPALRAVYSERLLGRPSMGTGDGGFRRYA